MTTLHLGCIVEGHGDVKAVPELVRRLHQEIDPGIGLDVSRPIRTGRYNLVKEDELERTLELAVRPLATPRAVLILIDAEGDCPAIVGPKLFARAQARYRDTPIGVVLAKREFEAWMIAAIESLGGKRGLRSQLRSPDEPEGIRDAKGFLTRLMEGSRSYSEPVDQVALTAIFDIRLARARSDSFDKCWREVERLLRSPDKSLADG